METLVAAGLFGLGGTELVVLLVLIVVFIWPTWRICTTAGFPGAMALLVVVPAGILVVC